MKHHGTADDGMWRMEHTNRSLSGNNGRAGSPKEEGLSLREKVNAGRRTVPESHLCPFPNPFLKPEWLKFQRNALWSR